LPRRRSDRASETVPSPATLTAPRTGTATAAATAPIASSSSTNCRRGSKPRKVGTTGERNSRMIGVSTVAPMTGCRRSTVQTTDG
jgi:hypothetical protein